MRYYKKTREERERKKEWNMNSYGDFDIEGI
jgi:hypothetical protein